MLQHSFNGTPFTVGIEEELMLLDPETLDLAHGIERILADVPERYEGMVKPELFQSVLEIATEPCRSLDEAATELGELRQMVAEVARGADMRLGAAGTHPFARWEDQRVVERERYQNLAAELGFIAEQELIFGTHVHVGMDDPDKAIYVADGIRRYLPMMLALSANSPYWHGRRTGMQSARTPVFRAFPRVGIPPHYGSWEIFSSRVEQMMRSGSIDDYTYLWWDVRPHPKLGTVEARVFDQATRIEDTIAYAALTLSLAHRLAQMYEAAQPLTEIPLELIDDNKVRAAVSGMDGELLDLVEGAHVPAAELVRRVLAEVGPSAEELGCAEELGRIEGIIRDGTGCRRQLQVAGENGGDLHGLVREVVLITA